MRVLFISLAIYIFVTLEPVKAQKLPPCPPNKSVDVWTNCIGTYIDSIGGKYVGAWKNGKFHGQGVTTFSEKSKWSGDKYIGGWKEGKKYGQGKYIYEDDTSKEGIWFNDEFLYSKKQELKPKPKPKAINKPSTSQKKKPPSLPCPEEQPREEWTNCIGTHTEFDLKKIPPTVRLKAKEYLINDLETDPTTVDQVISDLMLGIQIPDETTSIVIEMLSGYGGTYVGEWEDGKFNGKGKTTFGSKTRWAKESYIGQFKNGKRHGKGTYIYTDGSIYLGNFENGEWHGKGTITNSYGDKYVGEFKQGKRDGLGSITTSNGHTFIGTFKNDISTGSGTFLKNITKKKQSKK